MNFMRMLGVVVLGSLMATPATAATLYIDPGTTTLFRGDAVTASIRIMPDEAISECINAADVVVSYPDSIQPVDVSIGRSILSVWVEDPVINKEAHTITFAGGIPNGYCGRVQGDPGLTNVLADIVFRSPGLQIGGTDSGDTAMIQFAPETQVYLNDGQGTQAELRTIPAVFTLDKSAGPGIVDDWRETVREDNTPPESFSISLERDTVAFSGRYFIVFSSSDKQTGISHYEVMEEPAAEFGTFSWGRTDAPWVRAMSPYELKDQSLNSTIRVRAYDKAGNEYVATLVPDPSLKTLSEAMLYTYIMIAALALLLIIIIVVLAVFIRRRLARRSDNNSDSTDTDSLEEEEDSEIV